MTKYQSAPAAIPVGKTSGGFLKLAKDVAAGTCGGIAVTLVGHPFDTVKVRLQTQSSVNPVYSGVVDCVRKTIQWEGVRGLYKGVTSPLAGQMLFRASLFGAFGQSKSWLATNSDGSTRVLTNADFFKAGAITGFVASFSESPIDFYKSQVQVQIIRSRSDPNYKPPFVKITDCIKQTVAVNGVRAPFQGLSATLARNIPANAIYLGMFEVLKRQAAESAGVPVNQLSAAAIMGSGAIAGTMYWVAIFPVDVVKSAMMTDAINPAERKYRTLASATKALYEDGGIKRFYRGFTPCLLRAMPANAVMLYTVDSVTAMLNK